MSLFFNIKRLFKHSAVYGIGHIINRSISFLLLPLHTNIFAEDIYGVAGLVFTYLAILTIVYTYGLDVAFFRFYILEQDAQKRRSIFSTAFTTVFYTTVLFSLALIVGAKPIAANLFGPESQALGIDLPMLIQLTAGILAFDALAFLPFLIFRAEEKSVPYILYKFINVALTLGLNIVLLVTLKTGIEGIFIANLIASAATFLCLVPMAMKYFHFSFSWSMLRELLEFGLPYLPATIAVVLMDTVDRVFIERLIGVEAVGLYNAGAKLGMFMALFVTAFRFAWHPFFLSTTKLENAKEIFARIFTYVILACGMVFLFFAFFIDDLVKIRIFGNPLIGETYWSATVVVPVIFLAYIFYAAYLNFLIGIYLEKKTRSLPFITIAGMIVNLLANFLLIPVIGIMGAAWARLFAYVVMAIALYFVSRPLYRIDYEWCRVLKFAILTAVFFFVSRIPFCESRLLLRILLFMGFPLALYSIGFIKSTELVRLRQLVKRLLPASGKTR